VWVVTDFGSSSEVAVDCFDGRMDVEYPQLVEERLPNGDDEPREPEDRGAPSQKCNSTIR